MNLKGIFVAIWHLFKPVEQDALQKFEAKVTPEVIDAAKNGIQAAADELLQDTAARDKAIEVAKADLVQAGHDIVDIAKSEWNAIIEIALVAVKGSGEVAKSSGAGTATGEGEAAAS